MSGEAGEAVLHMLCQQVAHHDAAVRSWGRPFVYGELLGIRPVEKEIGQQLIAGGGKFVQLPYA